MLRVTVWGSVAFAIFWVANLADKPVKHKQAMGTIHELKTEVSRIWLAQISQVDIINETANALIQARNLKPGDPLPPQEVFLAILRKSPKTTGMGHLNSKEAIHVKSWEHVTNKVLEAHCAAILAVNDKVPTKPEPYAATGMFGTETLVPGGGQIHPETQSAKKLIGKSLEITGGLEDAPE